MAITWLKQKKYRCIRYKRVPSTRAGTFRHNVKLADGTILSIETDALWGKVVTIDHGFGIKSRYCGIEPGDIEKGQKVEVSEVIGTLGDIPCELLDGPHLHLEITVNGAYTAPVEAIGREVKAASATAAKTTGGGASTTAGTKAGTTTAKK